MDKSYHRFSLFISKFKALFTKATYLKSEEQYAEFLMLDCARLSRKVMERLLYQRIKINDHSGIFCETCILVLFQASTQLNTVFNAQTEGKMMEKITLHFTDIARRHHTIAQNNSREFQAHLHNQYRSRAKIYAQCNKVYSDDINHASIVNLYLDFVLENLKVQYRVQEIKSDLLSVVLPILIPFDHSLKRVSRKQNLLFSHSYL
jgi:hypothetical protein